MGRICASFAVVVGVLVAFATGASSALAAPAPFTGSGITAPANDSELFWDDDNGTGDVTVTGTVTDPTATAEGDLVCYSPGSSPAELLGSVDVSSGSFSVDVDLQGAYGEACQLLMVPDVSGSFPAAGSDLSAYSGPAISISDLFSHSANGNLYGYYIESGTLQWSWGLQSSGECPVSASYETDPSTLFFVGLFAGNACLPYETGIEPDLNSRSALEVDGLNAYLPGALDPPPKETGPNLTGVAGFQPLQYTPTFGPNHASVTIAETDIPTICSAPGTFPPSTTTCPALTDSGIKLTQTSALVKGGQVARVQQQFTNVDGRSHTVDLLFTQAVESPESGEQPGFEFPGQHTVATHAEPDSFSEFPSGPGSIVVIGDADAAPSVGNPIGAITYSQPPLSANFISASGDSTATFTMHYVQTLAPGASITYGWSFTQATSTASLSGLEEAERDRFSVPAITIVSQAKGAVSRQSSIRVHGLVNDSVGIRSVTVDSRPAPLEPGGTWAASVRLSPGRNQLVAVATNIAGNSQQTSEFVTYAPLSCVVPVLRGDTVAVARSALAHAHCRVGKIVKIRSHKIRKEHVVDTRPPAGTRRDVSARVRLYVSRGR
jgi:hypothetical protein